MNSWSITTLSCFVSFKVHEDVVQRLEQAENSFTLNNDNLEVSSVTLFRKYLKQTNNSQRWSRQCCCCWATTECLLYVIVKLDTSLCCSHYYCNFIMLRFDQSQHVLFSHHGRSRYNIRNRIFWCLNQTEGHLYFFIHFIICTLDWMEEIWQMNCDKRQQQMISTGAGVNTWLAAACRRCQVLPTTLDISHSAGAGCGHKLLDLHNSLVTGFCPG